MHTVFLLSAGWKQRVMFIESYKILEMRIQHQITILPLNIMLLLLF